MNGYGSSLYGEALSEFGLPLQLTESGGSVLVRGIPGHSESDAMGPYPLFCCRRWHALGADFELLAARGLVAVALVPDPFGPLSQTDLAQVFDVVVPFKSHYVYDLSKPVAAVASRHHRYYARKALGEVSFQVCPDPVAFVDEWDALYRVLAARHGLQGLKAFSRESFEKQLAVPGMVAIRGECEGESVAGQLWYVQGNVAYSHLTAVNEHGYRNRATYGLYHSAINYFAEAYNGTVQWLDLGGGAGGGVSEKDGLSEFKEGWSTGARQAYFCGRTLRPDRYQEICRMTGTSATSYFPAYRDGEMTRKLSPTE